MGAGMKSRRSLRPSDRTDPYAYASVDGDDLLLPAAGCAARIDAVGGRLGP